MVIRGVKGFFAIILFLLIIFNASAASFSLFDFSAKAVFVQGIQDSNYFSSIINSPDSQKEINFFSSPANSIQTAQSGCDTCLVPDSLGDVVKEILTYDHEITLQQFLASRGYIFDVLNDQKNTQVWKTNQSAQIQIKYIGKVASYGHTFGYYLDGNKSTFKPIFEDNGGYDNPKYNVPIAHFNDTFTINVPAGSKVGFAIDSYHNGEKGFTYSENKFNEDSKDLMLVFNSCNEFILAFDDTFGDYDYQDIVVVIKSLSCTSPPFCGDGKINQASEQCDDGNLINNDSCSNDCNINTYCGDGHLDAGEQCDDGNTINNDSCSNQCETISCHSNLECGTNFNSTNFCTGNNVTQNQTTFICHYPGQENSYCSNSTSTNVTQRCDSGCSDGECNQPECGDGHVDSGEECDLGSSNGNVCVPNYNDFCVYCGDKCDYVKLKGPYCGDHIVNGNETCDDGNTNNTDSCNNQCQINVCIPKTCVQLGKICGNFSDGCGGTLNCGPSTTSCSSQFGTCYVNGTKTCNVNGTGYGSCNAVDPRTSNCQGLECGNNLCGGSCGTCLGNESCNQGICIPVPYCGDGHLDSGEQCDDHNNVNGDGCDSTCHYEIKCSNNSQCGTDFYSNNFCIGDNVAKNKTTFICHYPATPQSYCSNSTSTNQTQQCQNACLNGECGQCVPEPLSVTCSKEFGEGYECGTATNNCGQKVNCGTCQQGQTCNYGQCVGNDCSTQDSDHDGVNDCIDTCPNTRTGEPVDKNGCDIFQFCNIVSCGSGCDQADWKGNEDTKNPHDCMTVVVSHEGKLYPKCVPTEFSNMCAG
ncbi:DUF4215 domain-containing protein [Candidatus Pacearchaeota archaeon]|nr:DUF4215 domain-containing protein [Candidatus Pacearchaeota archaeon]